MLIFVMLIVVFYCYAECRQAKCRQAQCRYAEYRFADCHYAECCGTLKCNITLKTF